jgi:hypothetical protein
MGGRARAVGLTLWLGVLGGACIPKLPIDSAPCPCDSAHECCPSTARDQCVPRGQLALCRVARDCPLPDGVTAPDLQLFEGSPDSSAVTPIGADHIVHLHYGIQGGFHVYLQFLLRYFDPRNVLITRRLLEPGTGLELGFQSEAHSFVCDASGAWALEQGQLTYVCPSLVAGKQMFDRDLTLEVTMADRQGGTGSFVRTFTIHPMCPDDDTRAYCMSSPRACAAGP